MRKYMNLQVYVLNVTKTVSLHEQHKNANKLWDRQKKTHIYSYSSFFSSMAFFITFDYEIKVYYESRPPCWS